MKNIKLIFFLVFTSILITTQADNNAFKDQLFANTAFNNKFATFPVNVIGADPAKQIYQIDVLSQFGLDGTCKNNTIYGATCGRHAFKNALFGLLTLGFYIKQDAAEFENYSLSLKTVTPEVDCFFREINLTLNQFRTDRELPINDETLSAEEVEYIINQISNLSNKCNIIPAHLQRLVTVPFFPGVNFKDILKGKTWGKAIISEIENIRNKRNYKTAFVVSVPGHWITLLVYKNNNIIKYIVMDSANNANRLSDSNVLQLIDVITDPTSFDIDKIKQKFDFEDVSDKLLQYSIKYQNYLAELQEAIANNDAFQIIELELEKIEDLKKEILALNLDIKNEDGFNPFVDRESLSNLLPLLSQPFQEQVAQDKIAYNKIKAARKLLAYLKNGSLIKKLKFPPSRNLKIFKESDDPSEYSYEWLIEKYNTYLNTNPSISRQFLTYIQEIAYTKEGYANKYAFIKKYLDKKGFSQKDIEKKLASANRDLKIFKEMNEPLEYSYEGMIEEYNNAVNSNDLNLAKKILTAINEIAYTKEGYANKFAFIRKYLVKKGFSPKELSEKLDE